MIKMSHVYAGYGNEKVLHDVNLSFEAGKITIIVGPNGCGKSTLLKTLIRMNPSTSGQIKIDGNLVDGLKSNELAQKIAYLPQGKHAPDITVKRMVLHGRFAYLKYPRRYRKEDYEMAEKAMKLVGIEDLEEKNVSQLSGGTQQKVYIAMAIAQDTPVVLMDEPTTYLDISHQMKLMEWARKLADQGKAVILVLHDLGQAFRYADQIVVMSEGKVLDCGSPEDIYIKEIVNDVFQIQMSRVLTESGYQYFVMQ